MLNLLLSLYNYHIIFLDIYIITTNYNNNYNEK